MMAFHRLEDNLILRQKGFDGITRAWWTLIWFWIPAHSITFSLPADFQIGLAALLSLVPGIIIIYSKGKKPVPAPAGTPASSDRCRYFFPTHRGTSGFAFAID